MPMKKTTLFLGKDKPLIALKDVSGEFSCAQEIIEVELSDSITTTAIILEDEFWKICPARFSSKMLADYVINPSDFWNLLLADGLNLFVSDRVDHLDNLAREIEFYIESQGSKFSIGSFYYVEGVETEVESLIRFLEMYYKGTFEKILNQILLGGTLISSSLGLKKSLLSLVESDHYEAEQSLLDLFNLKSIPRQ